MRSLRRVNTIHTERGTGVLCFAQDSLDDEVDNDDSIPDVRLVEVDGRVTPLVTGEEVVGGLVVGVTVSSSSSTGVVVMGARVGPTAVVPGEVVDVVD